MKNLNVKIKARIVQTVMFIVKINAKIPISLAKSVRDQVKARVKTGTVKTVSRILAI